MMDEQVSGAELEAITRRHANLWSTHDAEAVSELYDEDCDEDVAQRVVMKGRDGVKTWAKGMFAAIPDIHVELTLIAASGGVTAREYVIAGTHAASGKQISIRGVSMLEFHGTKIIRNSDYYDAGSFAAQTTS
ncbi:MAG TPA: ester cyclase [Dehalococcoidia bacterium]|nr:ester cyclase [Dehalococcoidia bacterium]